jgi:predicted nucleic acid-binding protein
VSGQLHAGEIEENYHLSFRDSLIVVAAYSKNAALILTEDLNHGQIIEGIRVPIAVAVLP